MMFENVRNVVAKSLLVALNLCYQYHSDTKPLVLVPIPMPVSVHLYISSIEYFIMYLLCTSVVSLVTVRRSGRQEPMVSLLPMQEERM